MGASVHDKTLPVTAPEFLRRVFGLRANAGNVLFVSSVAGTNKRLFNRGRGGETPESAFPTIRAALDAAEENKDDLIVLLPGHSEMLDADGALDFDKAGVTLVAFGRGQRPRLVIGSAVAASSVVFSAPDVSLLGALDFVAGRDGLIAPVKVQDGADRLLLRGVASQGVHRSNRFYLGAGVIVAPTTWIDLDPAADDFLFGGNDMENAQGIVNIAPGFLNRGSGSGDEADWNYMPMTLDGTSAAANTVGEHRLATVTGQVEMVILPACRLDMGEAAATSQIQLGYTGATGAFVPATNVLDIDAGEYWLSAAPAGVIAAPAAISRVILSPDAALVPRNVGYEVLAQAINAGELRFYIKWRPCATQALVLPGNLGALT